MLFRSIRRIKAVGLSEIRTQLSVKIISCEMVISVKKAAAVLGRKGGKSKSEKKQKAVRENGKKGGRPKK